jgi:hypothetical protein
MCTASVYKGMNGLFMQALRTAGAYGVLDEVLADLAEAGFPAPTAGVVMAATKAQRYVPEMREIAATQRAVGLPASLFEGFAEVFEQVAATKLATHDPESADLTMPAAEAVRYLNE